MIKMKENQNWNKANQTKEEKESQLHVFSR